MWAVTCAFSWLGGSCYLQVRATVAAFSLLPQALYLALAVACLLAFSGNRNCSCIYLHFWHSCYFATLALALNRSVYFWYWQSIAIAHPTSGIHKGSFLRFVCAGS